eukprot:Gb_36615 [translate_table: standard]
MTQDVEMKDSAAPSNSSAPSHSSVLSHLKSVAALIEKGVVTKEVRLMIRAIRHAMTLRRKIKASIVLAFLKHLLPPGSEAGSRLLPYFAKARASIPRLSNLASLLKAITLHSSEEHEEMLIQ